MPSITNDQDDVPELSKALQAGDLNRVKTLLAAGADVRYQRPHGYDALLDAVHSPSVLDAPRLLETLVLLVRQGAELSTVSEYSESAVRVLSRLGRFDAVAYLLKAGADRGLLGWTPLHEAVALGSVAEVEKAVTAGSDFEARDF
jgi:ankyrin repeat protein